MEEMVTYYSSHKSEVVKPVKLERVLAAFKNAVIQYQSAVLFKSALRLNIGQVPHGKFAKCHTVNRPSAIAPQFWDAVRNEVDRRDDDGQFILTGSAVPPKPKKDEKGNLIEGEQIYHTGTGRISRLRLRTMMRIPWRGHLTCGARRLSGHRTHAILSTLQ